MNYRVCLFGEFLSLLKQVIITSKKIRLSKMYENFASFLALHICIKDVIKPKNILVVQLILQIRITYFLNPLYVINRLISHYIFTGNIFSFCLPFLITYKLMTDCHFSLFQFYSNSYLKNFAFKSMTFNYICTSVLDWKKQ